MQTPLSDVPGMSPGAIRDTMLEFDNFLSMVCLTRLGSLWSLGCSCRNEDSFLFHFLLDVDSHAPITGDEQAGDAAMRPSLVCPAA
jgi:hypothetical protein